MLGQSLFCAEIGVQVRPQAALVAALPVDGRDLFVQLHRQMCSNCIPARNAIVVIFAALFSFGRYYNGHNDITIVGYIPSGFPTVAAPPASQAQFSVSRLPIMQLHRRSRSALVARP